MTHQHVENCLMHPLPGDALDPIGPLLRDLDRVATELQQVVPARLYGDRTIIDGAILALLLVRRRIDELSAKPMVAAE